MKNSNYKMKILSKFGSLLGVGAIVSLSMININSTASQAIVNDEISAVTNETLVNNDGGLAENNVFTGVGSVYEVRNEVDSNTYRYTVLSVPTHHAGKVSVAGSKTHPVTEDAIIPESVTLSGSVYDVVTIQSNAFESCTGLTSVVIPDSITSISAHAFNNCVELKAVSIGSGVTSIGDKAFYNCSKLIGVTIPSSVDSINDSVFENCTSLSDVVLPEGLHSIGKNAFKNCCYLSTIEIPSTVTSIGDEAFSNYWGLESVKVWAEIPPSLGDNVFGNVHPDFCVYVNSSSLKTYKKAPGWENFSSRILGFVDAFIYNYDFTCTILAPATVNKPGAVSIQAMHGRKLDSHIIIPSTVQFEGLNYKVISIADKGFCGHEELSRVQITDGVTVIGMKAFYDCRSLKEISFGNGVTSIGAEAFSSCEKLTNITIPDSIKTIGAWAFSGCNYLYNVTIKATTPPVFGTHVFGDKWFYGPTFWSWNLWVPLESVAAYENVPSFQGFDNPVNIKPIQ